jgi:drug/metabolite transporter (DMT)-like permease
MSETGGVLANERGDPGDRRGALTGVALLCAAALLWSLNGALIKLIIAREEAPHGVTIAFYRSLFAGLFLVPLAFGRFHTLRRSTGRRGSQSASCERAEGTGSLPHGRGSDPDGSANFLLTSDIASQRRGRTFAVLIARVSLGLRPAAAACIVLFTLMTACFVIANTLTESANAIILQYTSTFWIFALSPWLLKESPHREDLWLLGLAMVGIAVIFGGRVSTDFAGLVIALMAGLSFGLLTLCIRQMRDSNPAAVTVANNLGSAILLVPFVLMLDSMMVDRRSFWLLVLMGVVQFGIPYYLYTLGLARIPAHRAALITLLEPILVPVWTFLAVGETPPGTTLVGGGLILLALVMILRASGRGAMAKTYARTGPMEEQKRGLDGETV